MKLRAILLAMAAIWPEVAAAGTGDCGGVAEPCTVAGGQYLIEMPPGPARGVLIYFHGYKGSAELALRQQHDLVQVALDHGLAFAAIDGLDGTWSHPNAVAQDRDEQAFMAAVFDDLTRRYGFGPDKTVLSGFSQGASMAWYTACAQGARVAGMVTFSGVFWNPLPKPADCVTPPPMVHFHGRADRTFPLAGRAIGTHHHQGDTFRSFAILRERGQCEVNRMAEVTLDGVQCQVAPGCLRGESALCLHDGGHRADAGQLDAALTRLGF